MTLPDEAVEAAARAILGLHGANRIATAALNAALPIIRAQVLEEAASVCEDFFSPAYDEDHTTCSVVADAIRALKENHP